MLYRGSDRERESKGHGETLVWEDNNVDFGKISTPINYVSRALHNLFYYIESFGQKLAIK